MTASKLYWDVCIPKLTYGFEVMDVKDASLEKVISFHYQAAKITQGLPEHAVNIGSVATIGWQPIESYIDILRLLFMWRILLLPMQNIYKTFLVRRILHLVDNYTKNALGPTKNVLDICIKYGLHQYVLAAIETAEYCTMNEWKKMIKLIATDRYVKSWNATKHLFTSLKFLKKDPTCLSPWWKYAAHNVAKVKRCKIIIQLLLGRERHQYKLCQYCDLCTRSTIPHVLFECRHLSKLREDLWVKVEEVCPPNLIDEINVMNNEGKTIFILNAVNTNYIPYFSMYKSTFFFSKQTSKHRG